MASYLGHYWDNRSVQEVDQVSGACLLARRSAIGQTGLSIVSPNQNKIIVNVFLGLLTYVV